MSRRLLVRSLALFLSVWVVSPVSAQVREPNPVIERIEPTSGPVGTEVQLIGRYFRPEQVVRVGEVQTEIVSRIPNRWTVRIPANATRGRVAIEVPNAAVILGPEFRVLSAPPAPVVRDVVPRSAPAGSEVRLIGEHFSPRTSDDTVTLGGAPVLVRTATATELVVVVPPESSGSRFRVEVRNGGSAESPVDFTITPGVSIAGFVPAVAAPGMRVTVTGAGFGTRAGTQRAFVGSTPARLVSATDASLTFEVPRGATTGLVMVDVRGVGRAYSPVPLSVQAAPVVTAIEPPAGPPGSRIRLRGSEFGADIRQVEVLFGTSPGIVRTLGPNELTVEVPEGASSAPLVVRVNGLATAAALPVFQVLVAPTIRDFQPRTGGPGTEVSISGSGFSLERARNRVLVASTPCEVLSATESELHVRIPAAASGPITVEVEHAGSARTNQAFVVTTPPFVAHFEPAVGASGSEVTILGTGFGTNPALAEVSLADRRMEIRSISPERIVAVVPSNGVSGRLRVTVRLQGSATSSTDFEVVGPFAISAVEPSEVSAGQWVTVRGTGFSSRGMTLDVNGAAVSFTFVNTTELRFVAPAGLAPGSMTLRLSGGRTATRALPTVTPTPPGMGIYALEPECLNPGCTMIVRGWGFGASPGLHRITLGTARIRARRSTPHEVEFALPQFVGTSTIRIELRGGGGVETPPLTIQPR
jgi:IPT/TIG domain